ncbi:SusC/RagA family TonB-linked outer membrane protein [Bacteroidia bacterium]|nr:SusC/RagA family TonB-linked outer membrane protein [Bacteroidia bacterium]GHU82327.1 SusC/RagA family TonB-linked outer membrane protein [Bacteroidia bacterium]
MTNAPLAKVIKEIESKSDYTFFINDTRVKTGTLVSVNLSNASIEQILKTAFASTDYSYEIIDKQILVKVKSESPQESSAARKVKGVVRDIQGEPVIGASVKVEGSGIGSATGIDGGYSLDVPDNNSVLTFSYLGYTPQSVAVKDKQTVDIILLEDFKSLDEVVVVGYGTQKKVNLTGSVSSVSGSDLVKRPVTNPVTMLQGQIPGLSVVQATGQPGNESASLRIRGQGTYSDAGSDPLVLIDGVPGTLSNLNANDIENVSVLKDASSASIYGSRAANGVILVTTKAGQENKFKVAYNVNVGVHTPTRLINLVTNSVQYMRLFNEAKTNSGTANSSTIYSDEMIALYENATDRTKYPNFNWLDYGFNPAVVQNHDLSVSGGSNGTTYNISTGYINQPGTLIGYGFEKYNFRTNIKSKLKDWITIGSNLSLERGDVKATAQGQEDAMLSLLSQAPTYSPKLPDGSGYTYYAYPFEDHNKNQVAITETGVTNKSVNYDASAQLWLELELFKGLTWYTKGAANLRDNTSKDWRQTVPLYNFHTGEVVSNLDVGTTGLTATNSKTFYTNLFSYLKYATTVGNHSFGAQVGYSQETNHYEYLRGYRKDFLAPLPELNAGTDNTNQRAEGTSYDWALMSLFGRLNYDYLGRYLAEVNVRYDGTSRMDQDKRWGYFPSFSLGWRLSEESFIKEPAGDWLTNLKVRGSYGLLGNQNINVNGQPYPYQSMLDYTGNYPFDNASLSTGVAQSAYSNKDIKWESSSIFDIGLDLTVFGGLSVTYDYYKKNTTDILRSAQVSTILGLTAPIVNSGAMVNYGHEISLQYAGQVASGTFKGLNYGAGVYYNKYKNEAANFGAEEIDGYYLRRNGLPYNSYYLLECIGVFQTQEEINNSPKQYSGNVKPGDLKYRDADENGVVDDKDKVVIDGKFPAFEYSFNLNASWKGFDISAFFQGVEGRKIFVNGWGYESFRQGTPPSTDWLDRWTGPGTSNWMPRITFNEQDNGENRRNSTWFLQDASYLRLKNLTAGYSLPKKLIAHARLEKARVYFSADNLLTFTQYKAFDPERAGDGRFAQYPQNKIVSFGLNVEF